MTTASTAPRLKVLGVEAFEQPYRHRLPFRFGVVTVTEGVQAFVRAHVRLDDGREGFGYAAEALAPKWFDKNPALDDEQNRHQLRKAIEMAAEAYREAPLSTAFDLYADHYRRQMRTGRELGLPPLVAGFGSALLDRAVLDAVCRSWRELLVGDAEQPRRHGRAPDPGRPRQRRLRLFLAGLEPARSIEARHTVGLLDPIVAADQPAGSRVDDGLPETLEEVVGATASAPSS